MAISAWVTMLHPVVLVDRRRPGLLVTTTPAPPTPVPTSGRGYPRGNR